MANTCVRPQNLYRTGIAEYAPISSPSRNIRLWTDHPRQLRPNLRAKRSSGQGLPKTPSNKRVSAVTSAALQFIGGFDLKLQSHSLYVASGSENSG